METQPTEDLTQYITEDVVVATARNSLQGECSWEAVDPLHQTIMGGRIQCFLKDALPALRDAGWTPPEPAYPDHLPVRTHPRGRLREVLADAFSSWVRPERARGMRSISEQIYNWHLGETRYVKLISLAREFNDVADMVEGYELEAFTPEAKVALQQVAAELRDKADSFEDQIEDPR